MESKQKQLMAESKDKIMREPKSPSGPHGNNTLSVSRNPSNTTRYYFENILRFDLLSKFNYNNIMEVPYITKVNILVHCLSISNINALSQALEIIIGQKFFSTILADPQSQPFLGSRKRGLFGKQRSQIKNERSKQPESLKAGKFMDLKNRGTFLNTSSALLCCCLRGRTKYNFLEKLISLRLASFRREAEYICKIQGQEVQLTLSTREVRLFPEIQNHFEFFESLKKIQIKLVTSARSERETQVLWTGLQQKEI